MFKGFWGRGSCWWGFVFATCIYGRVPGEIKRYRRWGWGCWTEIRVADRILSAWFMSEFEIERAIRWRSFQERWGCKMEELVYTPFVIVTLSSLCLLSSHSNVTTHQSNSSPLDSYDWDQISTHQIFKMRLPIDKPWAGESCSLGSQDDGLRGGREVWGRLIEMVFPSAEVPVAYLEIGLYCKVTSFWFVGRNIQASSECLKSKLSQQYLQPHTAWPWQTEQISSLETTTLHYYINQSPIGENKQLIGWKRGFSRATDLSERGKGQWIGASTSHRSRCNVWWWRARPWERHSSWLCVDKTILTKPWYC